MRIEDRDPRLVDFVLKPCPKCGAPGEWHRPMGNRLYADKPPYYGHKHYRVSCSADPSVCCVIGNSYPTATLAAMHWNERIEPEAASLWHAKLESLEGFYQSDVMVVSIGKEAAILQAEEAVSNWHTKWVDEYYYSPVLSSDPGDEDYEHELAAWMKEVRSELEAKLSEVSGGAMVMREI